MLYGTSVSNHLEMVSDNVELRV